MNKIKELRVSRNLTQEELARKVDLDVRMLEQYESGITELPAEVLRRLADFFKVSTRRVSGLPEVSATLQHMKPSTLADAMKIRQEYDAQSVNVCLGEGWKLLHIGEDMERDAAGNGQSHIVYTLGWFGNPKDAREDFPFDDRTIFL